MLSILRILNPPIQLIPSSPVRSHTDLIQIPYPQSRDSTATLELFLDHNLGCRAESTLKPQQTAVTTRMSPVSRQCRVAVCCAVYVALFGDHIPRLTISGGARLGRRAYFTDGLLVRHGARNDVCTDVRDSSVMKVEVEVEGPTALVNGPIRSADM